MKSRESIIKTLDKRDKIIFNETYDETAYHGGLRYFDCLRRNSLRLLLDKKLFNAHPWKKYLEFIWFMEQLGDDNSLFLHGFVYGADRKEALNCSQNGIVIEGIGRDSNWEKNDEAKKVFKYLFSDANSFSLNPPLAFYD